MTGFGDLNLKMPLILAISVLISSLNFMLSRVEHEKSFKTSDTCISGSVKLFLALLLLCVTLCKMQILYFSFVSRNID